MQEMLTKPNGGIEIIHLTFWQGLEISLIIVLAIILIRDIIGFFLKTGELANELKKVNDQLEKIVKKLGNVHEDPEIPTRHNGSW